MIPNLKYRMLAASLILILSGCQREPDSQTSGSESAMNQYLYQYLEPLRPGLLEREWTEEENAIYEAHVAHLKKGAEESIVILAGRCQDGIGPAIVIIETSTEYEAHRFMDNDPFVRDGLFRASIHPYRVAIARTPF